MKLDSKGFIKSLNCQEDGSRAGSLAAFRPTSELVVRLPQGRDFPTAAPGRVSAPGLGTRTGLGQTRSLRQCQALAEPLLAHPLALLHQTIVWQLKTLSSTKL